MRDHFCRLSGTRNHCVGVNGNTRSRGQLLAAFHKMPVQRQQISLTRQRQHFYVAADQLNTERSKLIRSLSAGDMSVYAEDRKKYDSCRGDRAGGITSARSVALQIVQLGVRTGTIRKRRLLLKSPRFSVRGIEGLITHLATTEGFVDRNKVGMIGFSRTGWHVEIRPDSFQSGICGG